MAGEVHGSVMRTETVSEVNWHERKRQDSRVESKGVKSENAFRAGVVATNAIMGFLRSKLIPCSLKVAGVVTLITRSNTIKNSLLLCILLVSLFSDVYAVTQYCIIG